jgi:Flp pilus assembly protein TadB
VAIFLAVCAAILSAGVAWGKYPGLVVGWTAFSVATIIQTTWLWLRSRRVMRQHSEASRLDSISGGLKAGMQDKV